MDLLRKGETELIGTNRHRELEVEKEKINRLVYGKNKPHTSTEKEEQQPNDEKYLFDRLHKTESSALPLFFLNWCLDEVPDRNDLVTTLDYMRCYPLRTEKKQLPVMREDMFGKFRHTLTER